jgi:hypothetical protein
MENLGYKEGSAKPKPAALTKRRMSRQRGSVIDNEVLPLSISPRYTLHLLNEKYQVHVYSVIIYDLHLDSKASQHQWYAGDKILKR